MKIRQSASAKMCVVVVAATAMTLSVNNAPAEDAARYFVHIDPVTRKPTAPKPGSVPVPLDAKTRNAFSTSSAGLKRVPSPVPGGGYMVNLKGRFQHGYVAVTDGRGGVAVPCISGIPQHGVTELSSEVDEGSEQR